MILFFFSLTSRLCIIRALYTVCVNDHNSYYSLKKNTYDFYAISFSITLVNASWLYEWRTKTKTTIQLNFDMHRLSFFIIKIILNMTLQGLYVVLGISLKDLSFSSTKKLEFRKCPFRMKSTRHCWIFCRSAYELNTYAVQNYSMF